MRKLFYAAVAAAAVWAVPAAAEVTTIKCESHDNQERVCRLPKHVQQVVISKQLSDKDCTDVENYAVLTAAREQYDVYVVQDLEDFVAENRYPTAQSINAEGLRRRGYSSERIALVKQMYRLLYRKGLTLDAARQQIDALRGEVPEADTDIALMQTFLAQASRGIVR